MYFRQQHQSYVIGGYDHEPLLVELEDIWGHNDAPEMPSMMPWSDSIFRKSMISAGEVIPALQNVELTRKVNGMFIFTLDGNPVLGESPQVKGFWSAEAVWITHGGGVGKAVAEWMVNGEPTMDLREADISRFLPHQLTHSYITKRGAQQYREVYDIIYPLQQMDDPRGLRTLPYHQRYEELGAHFVESSGWERPQWFEANAGLLEGSTDDDHTRTGWESQFWSPIIGAEHRAVRERVGLFDLTPFTKLDLQGPGALPFLQRITANQINKPVGSVIYTSMLTPKGRIKCDLTITRLADDQFMIVTGGGTAEHDKAWIYRHMPDDGSVNITDESTKWCCIGVWGPQARELMRNATDDDVSSTGFPYLTAKHITVGEIPALALRISYAGELGWEIYAPFEFGQKLWDELWEAGRHKGVVAAGLGAFDSLRLEKGYRLWGNDIHTEYNPFEAGIGFAVRMHKGDFIGRDALVKARQDGLSKKLCCMTFDDPNVAVMGKEPIYVGDQVVSYVTSANYGYSVGKSIVYGYLPIEHADAGTKVDVEYFGERYSATVTDEPLWDPKMERLKR
jgi:glycine cleavage system T protein